MIHQGEDQVLDRRQLKTREAIFTSFSKLLIEKHFSKITVQEIIDEANIGRSTFYSHFETKDELLEELCTDLFKHVFTDSPVPESSLDYSQIHRNLSTYLSHILFHIRANKHIIGILNGDSAEIFLRFFKQYLQKLIFVYILRNHTKAVENDWNSFVNNLTLTSFVEVVHWWIKGGCRIDPEVVSEWYLKAVLPLLADPIESL